nr:MAG TPA: hypothetical protein [Caudoviricetes sp.]
MAENNSPSFAKVGEFYITLIFTIGFFEPLKSKT